MLEQKINEYELKLKEISQEKQTQEVLAKMPQLLSESQRLKK